jgi:hypothetical protein
MDLKNMAQKYSSVVKSLGKPVSKMKLKVLGSISSDFQSRN